MQATAIRLAALLAALAATGCYQPFGAPESERGARLSSQGFRDAGGPDTFEVDASAWNVRNIASVVDVSIEGELGGVRADGEECWVDSSNNVCFGTSLSVDIRCRTDDGVVMNRVRVDDWRELRSDGPNRSGDAAGQLSVQGCSGSQEDEWLADQMTEDVTLFVVRDPATRALRISFVANFWFGEGAEQSTEGVFTLPYYD